jgi:hypothetical protein
MKRKVVRSKGVMNEVAIASEMGAKVAERVGGPKTTEVGAQAETFAAASTVRGSSAEEPLIAAADIHSRSLNEWYGLARSLVHWNRQ